MQATVDANGAPPRAAYEFNDTENATIERTATFARAWGIISIASGVLLGLLSALMLVMLRNTNGTINGIPVGAVAASLAPLAFVYLSCGWFYVTSGRSLFDVVRTQGNDIALLIRSIESLKKAFMIEAVASVLAIVVGFGLGLLAHTGKG